MTTILATKFHQTYLQQLGFTNKTKPQLLQLFEVKKICHQYHSIILIQYIEKARSSTSEIWLITVKQVSR